MDGIFISYRRDDSAGYAGRLYDRLAAHFGEARVFMDVEGIEPGTDFVTAIEEAVSSCRVLIVMIGDEWVSGTDAAGRRRLDDPNDFVRLETASALRRNIRVVPVLVGGAVMPLAPDVPEELRALTRRQAIEISHKQWESSTGELIRTLERILSSGEPVADGAAPARSLPLAATSTPAGPGWRAAWPWWGAGALAVAAGGAWWWQGGPAGVPPPPAEPTPLGQASAPAGGPTGGSAAMPSAPAAPPTPVASPPLAPATALAPATPPPASPVPTPAVSGAAAPAAGGTTTVAAVPTVPTPRIREFRMEARASGRRLCYRVSDAESLVLSPRPGELAALQQDCVNVDADGASTATTTFTLTARGAGHAVRRSVVVAPLPRLLPDGGPVLASPPVRVPRPPVAVGQPDAGGGGSGPAALPRPGERWSYRWSGKWPTSPKWRYDIVVQSVADGLVTDALRPADPVAGPAPEVRRSRNTQPDFAAWSRLGLEFSPYLGAYVALGQLGTQRGFATPSFDPQWAEWHSEARVIGTESVSVPAGTYTAHKVEVWSSRRATGGIITAQIEPVRVQYLVWYAPQAKRYVKLQRRITSAGGQEIEKDLVELTAHQP